MNNFLPPGALSGFSLPDEEESQLMMQPGAGAYPTNVTQDNGFWNNLMDRVGLGPVSTAMYDDRGLMNPKAQAFGHGLQRIAAINQGKDPGASTALIFSRAQEQNQALMRYKAQMMEAKKLRQLQMQKAEQDLNPFHAFESFVKMRGLENEPYENQLAEYKEFFRASMKSTDAPSSVREFEYFEGLNPEQQAIFLRNKRAGSMFNLPGGGIASLGPDGSITPLVSTEDAIAGAADKEAATTNAAASANYNWENVQAANESLYSAEAAYDIAQSMYDTSEQYLKMLDSDDPNTQLDTGPVDAFLFNLFGVGTEQLAQMDAEAIEQTMNNLQITNLAPVTERELIAVGKLWASIARQETPNRGTLKRAMEKSQSAMRKLERDVKNNGSRLKTFSSQEELDRVINSSDFLRRVYGRASQDGTVRVK